MTGNAMLGLSQDIKHSSWNVELTNKRESYAGSGEDLLELPYLVFTLRQGFKEELQLRPASENVSRRGKKKNMAGYTE